MKGLIFLSSSLSTSTASSTYVSSNGVALDDRGYILEYHHTQSKRVEKRGVNIYTLTRKLRGCVLVLCGGGVSGEVRERV